MSAERGFTLLEVMVAFVIAALALGVLYEGAIGGLRSVRVSGQYQEALSRAESHLAALGQAGPLQAGTQQGDDGHGFHWQTRVAPLASAPVAHGDAVTMARGPRAVLYAVEVVESWQNGSKSRSVRLESRRVGRAAPPPP